MARSGYRRMAPRAHECTFMVHAPGGYRCQIIFSCYHGYSVYFVRLAWQTELDHELVTIAPHQAILSSQRILRDSVSRSTSGMLDPWLHEDLPFYRYRTQWKAQPYGGPNGEGSRYRREEPQQKRTPSVNRAFDWRNYCELDFGKSKRTFAEFCALVIADIKSEMNRLDDEWRIEPKPIYATYDFEVAEDIERLVEQFLSGDTAHSDWGHYDHLYTP